MAQEATLKKMANTKPRRISERNRASGRADTAFGDSAIIYEWISRKSPLRRCGPASFLELEETGVTVRFRSQTFKIARCCVCKRMVTSPGARLGGKNSKELCCEMGNANGPLDVQAPRKPGGAGLLIDTVRQGPAAAFVLILRG